MIELNQQILNYQPLSTNEKFQFKSSEGFITVLDETQNEIFKAQSLQADHLNILKNESSLALKVALEYLFTHTPLSRIHTSEGQEFTRESFFQDPELWSRKAKFDLNQTQVMTETNSRSHPVRPRLQTGVCYRRYVPELGKTITFRTVDAEKDLDLFHNWQNQPRVANLWDLNKPKDELKTYLEKGLKDLHQIPMFVEMDQEPVGYFEIYWIPEDRLAPYYEYQMYDRGFHFLIGNKNYLGVKNTGAIVKSVMHMIFIDEPQTTEIAVEPRSDNAQVIKYSLLIPGWRFVKEFDFPHKRSALLMANRDKFFQGGNL